MSEHGLRGKEKSTHLMESDSGALHLTEDPTFQNLYNTLLHTPPPWRPRLFGAPGTPAWLSGTQAH